MDGGQVGAAYDARAREYADLLGSVDQLAPADRVRIVDWASGCTGPLLDAGCGPGHWTDLLGRAGHEVTGLDASERFLATSKRRFPRLRLVRGDLARLPFADGSLAGVLAWFSLIHADPVELDGLLAEVARVLAPGGSVLLGYFDGTAGAPFEHQVTPARTWTAAALGGRLARVGLAVEDGVHRSEPGRRPVASLTAHRPAPIGG